MVPVPGVTIVISIPVSMFIMTTVHEDVHQGTGEQQKIRQDAEDMCPMLAK
jgi:hypothetical protein